MAPAPGQGALAVEVRAGLEPDEPLARRPARARPPPHPPRRPRRARPARPPRGRLRGTDRRHGRLADDGRTLRLDAVVARPDGSATLRRGADGDAGHRQRRRRPRASAPGSPRRSSTPAPPTSPPWAPSDDRDPRAAAVRLARPGAPPDGRPQPRRRRARRRGRRGGRRAPHRDRAARGPHRAGRRPARPRVRLVRVARRDQRRRRARAGGPRAGERRQPDAAARRRPRARRRHRPRHRPRAARGRASSPTWCPAASRPSRGAGRGVPGARRAGAACCSPAATWRRRRSPTGCARAAGTWPTSSRTGPCRPPPPPAEVREAWADGTIRAALLTSASTVRELAARLGPPPTTTLMIGIGPSTAAEAARLGLPLAGIATEQTMTRHGRRPDAGGHHRRCPPRSPAPRSSDDRRPSRSARAGCAPPPRCAA